MLEAISSSISHRMSEVVNNFLSAGTSIDHLSGASEYWHFDALSDDGREALIVTFHNNYAFSPRFFREAKQNGSAPSKRFPAVTFTYSVDGTIVLRAVNEFTAGEFPNNRERCTIGKSSFEQSCAAYGSGFMLHIDLLTARKCRLEADLEWVTIETRDSRSAGDDSAARSIVVPRSDVSGRIMRIGRRGLTQKVFNFRGTGYHDHVQGGDLLENAAARIFGRAHFIDATAIFECRDKEESRVVICRDGVMTERNAKMEAQSYRRDRYGLSFAQRLSFVTDDNLRVRVKPLMAIESGFFKKTMTSEITLMLRDGKPRKTTGIVEFTTPGRMKNGVFRWLSDLRIGKNGRSPLF